MHLLQYKEHFNVDMKGRWKHANGMGLKATMFKTEKRAWGRLANRKKFTTYRMDIVDVSCTKEGRYPMHLTMRKFKLLDVKGGWKSLRRGYQEHKHANEVLISKQTSSLIASSFKRVFNVKT